MAVFHCVACGAQYPEGPAPPAACAICQDERQYVGLEGQRWIAREDLAREHRNRVEEAEPGLLAIGVEPKFAIGQRALLTGGLLWDCVALLDDAGAARIEQAGGAHTIAISHPHYYTGMADLAERLDARILLHEADRAWITRPSDRVQLWSGDRHPVGEGLELVRLGGHFEGGTVCVWSGGADGRGALLAGDIVQVVPDRDWVSFMYSYPNYIPLPAREVARIGAVLDGLRFERIYGAFWDMVVAGDAHSKAQRSVARYLAALT